MATISGRVVFDVNRSASIDAGDTGLANIPVVLQNTSTNQRLVVLTDASGNYSFTNVPNGNYSITEAYGQSGGVATPGNFASAVVGAVPVANDPPIGSATNPPVGANNIDSLSPNTLFVTVAGADLTNQNFLDGPVMYTSINTILDPCSSIVPTNLITAADNGTFGTYPTGTAINTLAPGTAANPPYPGVTPGFIYTQTLGPNDGYYNINNIYTNTGGVWWNITNQGVGDETGRFMVINGANPGATIFQNTVSVTPNTNYLFSSWVANMVKVNGLVNPALGVEILDQNGGIIYQQTLGSLLNANTTIPEWRQIGTALNSGNNTQLTVKFLSQGPAAGGNDFVLDTIELQPISIPNFMPVKSVTPSYANLGDVVTYTVTLSNTCTNTLTNVSFQDTIPNGLSFLPGSVTVNGVNNASLNPQTGFPVATVPSLGSAVISFSATVTSIPSPNNPTNNTAAMSYSYSPVLGGIPVSYAKLSNTVPVTVNHADIVSPGNFNKGTNKSYADVGDTITYTITLANTGSTSANNVVITDTIPSYLTLIPSSVNVSTPFTLGSPSLKLNLTNGVPANTGVTVTFQVVVNTIPSTNPIQNSAAISYTYTVNPSIPDSASASTITNTVTTQVNNANLVSTKGSNKQTTTVGDTITYTVTITNSGNVGTSTAIFIDTVPNGTTFIPNSLTVNGVANTGNPNIGVNISPMIAGQTDTIVFSVVVTSTMPSLPISNTATIVYSYIVDPSQPPKSVTNTSNTNNTNLAQISITKATDKSYAQVGNTVTYTNVITNTGNATIADIIFTDTPPAGTTYVSPSVTINTVLYPSLNPNTPIDLGTQIPSSFPLSPGQSINVSFKVVVNTIPQNPIITNTASSGFTYTNGSQTNTSNTNSNTVSTTVRDGELDLIKSSNVTTIAVGDTLTYTILATNSGNVPVQNVIIYDTIPSQTSFVNGSVTINGVPNTSANPSTGINVGTVDAKTSAIITFSVVVNSIPPSGQIQNSSSSSFQVLVDPNGPPVTKNSRSNTVTNTVKNVQVLLIKQCSPSNISVGDTVTYGFTAINNGDVDITNLIFFDTLPSNISFINGSFVGSTQSSVSSQDLITGVSIGDLTIGSSKSFSFKVTVSSGACPPTITNIGVASYNYQLIQNQISTKISQSNPCSIDIANNSFKQIYKDGKLTIPPQKPDIEDILDISITSSTMNSELISSPKGVSQDGQILTGKKLLICTMFNISVQYVASLPNQSVHTANYQVSSCEYIVVPASMSESCCSGFKTYVEDIYYERLSDRELFYNITYLINSLC